MKFVDGPRDVYVLIGDDTYFNCTYIGTYELPSIVINGVYRTANNLPPRHTYDSMMVVVSNIQLSDNHAQYQCTFPGVFSTVGRINIEGSLVAMWARPILWVDRRKGFGLSSVMSCE